MTISLIRAGLINVTELDVQLAKMVVRDFAAPVIAFTADIIQECVLQENPCASRGQLAQSLDALLRAAENGRGTEL